MTSIVPQPQFASLHGVPFAPSASETSSSSGSDFAALLRDAQSEANSNVFVPSSQSVPWQGLQSAIAEVFDAFGFFGRSVSASQVPSSEPSAVAESDETTIAQPAPTEARTSVSLPTEIGVTGIDLRDTSEGQFAEAAAPDRASADPSGHKLVELKRGENPLLDPGVQLTEAASPESPGESAAPEIISKSRQERSQPSAVSGDRFTFQVGEHVVEVIARSEHLSSDEEQHLLSEIESLLKSHGLTLGSATINGRPVVDPLSRSLA